MHSRKTCIILIILAVIALSGGCGGDFLVQKGASEYRIVISENASPSTVYGADELRRFMKEMTGADLPIVTDESEATGKEIVIGDNRRLESLGVDVDFAALGEEGYVHRTVGGNIVIAGGLKRGNFYGVYCLV